MSTHFHLVADINGIQEIKPSDNNNFTKLDVNISLFLDRTVSMTPYFISHRAMLEYPPNAVLEIEGFLGIDEKANVVSALKDAAAAGGTVLVVESVKKGRR